MIQHNRLSGQLISFEALDKVQLEGLLCAPIKSKTCIVHVHGMTDNFIGLSLVDNLMSASAQNGFSFFTFNNRGMGTITTFQRLKEHLSFRTIGTSFENFKDCILDIHAVMKMLKSYGYKNFILSGHSTGCQKITYYQARKQSKAIKGLILLGPADDLNYQKKLLGIKKFNAKLLIAKDLVKKGCGKTIMPPEIESSYFSAKRYFELYKQDSVEGNLFNYKGRLNALSKINVPVLSIFGSKEEFAAISPKKMLRILSQKFMHPYSREILIPDADHCFCLYEENIETAVSRWLNNLIL